LRAYGEQHPIGERLELNEALVDNAWVSSSASNAFEYDLFVIGAGSGGLATAQRAASYGARVAIAEDDRVGGTCVIRGCIPKKLMVYAAAMGGFLDDAGGYGWSVGERTHSWRELVAKRDAAVANLERIHEGHLANAGVDLLRGRARLVAANEVCLGERRYRCRYVLVASGSTPILPDIDGIEHTITSDGFFELDERPERVAIVGGGYIAVEFASILAGLGSRVSLIIRRELPLRGFDIDLRRELLACLVEQGIDVHASTTVSCIEADGGGVRLFLQNPECAEELGAEQALVYAVGRRPNSADIGLEDVRVELGAGGQIAVDAHGVTSVPSVLAVGDVTGKSPLTPVAIQAGRAMADRIFGGKPVTMSYDDIPTAVFTEPPIGTVGLSEDEARECLGDDGIRVYKARFTPLVHALTDRKLPTLVKMIVDADSDRVLGCHMIGHDAPEIIQGLAVAIKAGATKADFDATVGIHPSSAEEFVTFS
jgi:glutathione reductase (NADPH)